MHAKIRFLLKKIIYFAHYFVLIKGRQQEKQQKCKNKHKRKMAQEDVFKKLVSHCKEYGFVFPSSDIYDGLGAVYDYGQMGVELKITSNNIGGRAWFYCTKIL